MVARRLGFVVNHLAAAILALVFLTPMLVAVVTSLKTISSVFAGTVLSFPGNPQWGNYGSVLTTDGFGRYALNSAVMSISGAVIQVIVATMAGYALARLPFRGRSIMFWVVLITMMLPPEVLVVPMFLLAVHFPFAGGNNWLGTGGTGLLNSFAGLIFPYSVSGLAIFLVRQFFIGLPKELEDAARMDGCSEFTMFVRVFVPLVSPVIWIVFLVAFQGAWTSFLWPLLMAKGTSMYTLQVGLSVFQQEFTAQWPLIMAAAILSSIPIMLIFMFAQGHIREGMIFSGIKD